MATTEPHTPTARAFRISELPRHLLQVVSALSARFRPHPEQRATPHTRAELIAGIVHAQRCHCGGSCPHCRHIIADVIGD